MLANAFLQPPIFSMFCSVKIYIQMAQLWGGCFSRSTNSELVHLNYSLPTDCRLFADDIDGSKAYSKALLRAGIITDKECREINIGLELVRNEWIESKIAFFPTDEDVHTVNERRLTELIGDAGEKLHTGRSRNDQVVTDLRLWMRKGVRETLQNLKTLIAAGVKLAEDNFTVMMPGYTHLQRAQAVLFPHWIFSHMMALKNDYHRFSQVGITSNLLPLGSGAIAGNPLGIDREYLAHILGFDQISENSMHSVGDRDFVVEFIFSCTMVSLHLSRLAEDLIIYATKEFGFVRISDEFSTGSSLMPQKRNPDSLELVRGMSGVIFSNLSGIMMTLKGTPSTYNKDFQFDKQYLFEAFDKSLDILKVMHGVLATLKVNREAIETSLSSDMLATDWAYYLVRKGIPFRKAHHLIGQVVAYAEANSIQLTDVPLPKLKEISDKFEHDITLHSTFSSSLYCYNTVGGTSSEAVKIQLGNFKLFILSDCE